MERLDKRALERIDGPAWDGLRSQFEAIHNMLISVSESVTGVLTTIYVKYATSPTAKPFAVLWIKNSKQLALGLALPEHYGHPLLVATPSGHAYSGLNKFVVVANGDAVPPEMAEVIRAAYEHVSAT